MTCRLPELGALTLAALTLADLVVELLGPEVRLIFHSWHTLVYILQKYEG